MQLIILLNAPQLVHLRILPFYPEKPAHGGVALFWKNFINDFVTPLEEIDSDRIVGIRCEFGNNDPLFILGVHLPSSSHQMDVVNECLDYLWALYDSLSAKGLVIIIGLNGDLGNSLGGHGKYEAKIAVQKILDFINFFQLVPCKSFVHKLWATRDICCSFW